MNIKTQKKSITCNCNCNCNCNFSLINHPIVEAAAEGRATMEFYDDDDDDEDEFPEVRMVQCGVHQIETTVTASAAVVSDWIDLHLRRFRPPYRPERWNADITVGMAVQRVRWRAHAAATLQLSIGRFCLIFQLTQAEECPVNLRRFMVDPNILFVGVWNQMDRELLWGSRHQLAANRPLDLRLVSVMETGRGRWMTTAMLAGLIVQQRGVLDNELVATGNWELPQLGSVQVEFLCHRAYLAYFIARILLTPILIRTGYVDRLLNRHRRP